MQSGKINRILLTEKLHDQLNLFIYRQSPIFFIFYKKLIIIIMQIKELLLLLVTLSPFWRTNHLPLPTTQILSKHSKPRQDCPVLEWSWFRTYVFG